jgi:hypothetical protein
MNLTSIIMLRLDNIVLQQPISNDSLIRLNEFASQFSVCSCNYYVTSLRTKKLSPLYTLPEFMALPRTSCSRHMLEYFRHNLCREGTLCKAHSLGRQRALCREPKKKHSSQMCQEHHLTIVTDLGRGDGVSCGPTPLPRASGRLSAQMAALPWATLWLSAQLRPWVVPVSGGPHVYAEIRWPGSRHRPDQWAPPEPRQPQAHSFVKS